MEEKSYKAKEMFWEGDNLYIVTDEGTFKFIGAYFVSRHYDTPKEPKQPIEIEEVPLEFDCVKPIMLANNVHYPILAEIEEIPQR